MPYEVPSRPWEQIAVDLFELRKKKIHGSYGLLQQLLEGRPPDKYYLSRNPETQKPFCTVWLP